ncbi:MAG: HEAT repeat domain-containing protein [bacterium]|nr:HEAT repeat domain-containing protein [bacterium]
MFKKMKINGLRKKLETGDISAKMQAAAQLGQLGEFQVLNSFMIWLDSGHDNVRHQAVCCLGAFGAKRSIEPLLQHLADGQAYIRDSVANALAKLGESKWNASIILCDDGDYIRLGQSGDRRVFPALARALGNTGQYMSRPDAARGLGELGGTDVIAFLMKFKNDSDANVRQAVVEALGKLDKKSKTGGDGKLEPAILASLRDRVHNVRLSAVETLAQNGSGEAVEGLKSVLTDTFPDIRIAARDALAILGQPQWEQWIKGDDLDVDRLAESHNGDAVEVLLKSMEHPEDKIRLKSAAALIEKGPAGIFSKLKDYAPYFFEDTQCRFRDIQKSAVYVLGFMENPEAVPYLVPCLGERNDSTRTAAADSLARLGHPKWKEIVKGDDGDIARLLDTRDPMLMHLATTVFFQLEEPGQKDLIRFLGELEDPNVIEILKDFRRILFNHYPVLKKQVVQILARRGDEDASRELLSTLDEADISELPVMVEVLGEEAETQAVNILKERLFNKEPEVRKEAAEAMAKLGKDKWIQWIKGDQADFRRMVQSDDREAKNVVKGMVKQLKHTLDDTPEENARLDILRQMAAIGSTPVLDKMVDLLRHEREDYREQAFKAFKGAAFDKSLMVELLFNSLSNSYYGMEGRDNIVHLINSVKSQDLVEPLRKGLKSDQFGLSAVCAPFINKIDHEGAFDFVIDVMKVPDSSILIHGAQALGRLGDPKAVEPLTKLLNDFRDEVRAAAVFALGELGDESVKETLFALLISPEDDLRKSAALTMEKLGDPQWKKFIKGNESDFKRLGNSGEKRFIPLLFEMIVSENTNDRKYAAQALQGLDGYTWTRCIKGEISDYSLLGRTGDKRVFEPLVSLLKGKSYHYAIEAIADGLVLLGDKRAVKPLTAKLGSDNIDVRIAAAKGLMDLGSSRGFRYLMDGLTYNSRESLGGGETRKKAAQILIDLYKKGKLNEEQRSKLLSRRDAISRPHSETFHHQSHDCCNSWHDDNGGIGLDF